MNQLLLHLLPFLLIHNGDPKILLHMLIISLVISLWQIFNQLQKVITQQITLILNYHLILLLNELISMISNVQMVIILLYVPFNLMTIHQKKINYLALISYYVFVVPIQMNLDNLQIHHQFPFKMIDINFSFLLFLLQGHKIIQLVFH